MVSPKLQVAGSCDVDKGARAEPILCGGISSVNVKESSDTVKVKVEGAVVAMSESVYRLRRFGGGPVNVSCWHVRDVTPAASRATVSRIERGDRRRNLATAKAE
jgi:hypothetical protein